MSEVVIRVENVSKLYRLGEVGTGSLAHDVNRWWHKVLSRVTTQSEGRIKVRGRIASLLEVGTGFHPELTGRENIFLNGAILGMRKAEPERRGGAEIGCRREALKALRIGRRANQIARKFDEIMEFSGCARYIDTPVTQAAGRPLERLPKAARRVRRAGASESTSIVPRCM